MKGCSPGLLLSLLCALSACGSGVDSRLGEDAGTGNWAPTLSRAESEMADVEGTALRIRVRGSGYTSASTVFWKEVALETTFVSTGELTALLPLDRALPGNEPTIPWHESVLSVRNPADSGSSSSRAAPVSPPALELRSVSPDEVPAAPAGPVRLRLTGRNFVRGSRFSFDGNQYPMTVSSMTAAEVELPAAALVNPLWQDGPVHVQSSMFQRYFWSSNAVSFKVGNGATELLGVRPAMLSTVADANQPAITLAVAARNLRTGSRLLLNGEPVVSYSVGSHSREIEFAVPAQARLKPGVLTVSLETPGSNAVTPASIRLPVVEAPVIYSLRPQWVQQNLGETLNLSGHGMGDAVEVYWDGTVLSSAWSGSDSAGVYVPPSLATRLGTHSVRVRRKSDGAYSAPILVEVVDAAPAPEVYQADPLVVTVGDSPTTLRIHGSGFRANSVIQIDGRDRPTRSEGNILLSTPLLASDLEAAGIHTITVRTPAPGGGTSLPMLLKVEARRPMPRLSGLSAPFAVAGTGPVTLLMSGTGLGPYSVIRWNNSFLTTRWEPVCCGAEFRLAADIPAGFLTQPGISRVSVFNPAPGGGQSNAIDFSVLPSGVSAPELFPRTAEAGGPGFTLTVRGSGFNTDTFVLVDDEPRSTTFADSSHVSVRLGVEDLAHERTLKVQTVVPRAGGSVTSAPQFLHVGPARPPILRSVWPAVLSVDDWSLSEYRSLSIRGANFSAAEPLDRDAPVKATLLWGGAGSYPLRYDYASMPGADGLVADLEGEALRPGVIEVSVSRESEGGGTSLPALVNVVAERPVPTALTVEPPVVRVGDASQVLRISGSGLHAASVVRWNGQVLATRRVSYSLHAVVPGELLEAPGVGLLTVETPAPGGGVSMPVPVSVAE